MKYCLTTDKLEKVDLLVSHIKVPRNFIRMPCRRYKVDRKINKIKIGEYPRVCVDEDYMIKDGYSTYLAYVELGFEIIPCIVSSATGFGGKTLVDRQYLFDMYNNTCYICGRILPYNELTFDHFIPISKGGSNAIDNLRCCCKMCNYLKDNKDFSAELVSSIKQTLRESGVIS